MQIHQISVEELDYVSRLCVDPWMPPTWREAMMPAMNARKEWLKAMMPQGLRVLVALEKVEALRSRSARSKKMRELIVDGNFPEGLIEYAPIEFAPEPVLGEKSLFINCVWVLPRFWHKGIARNLLETFIEDAKIHGGASVLAYEGDKWFGFFPYMPVSFFKSFGFKEVDRDGNRVMLHLDLGAHATPTLIRPKARRSEKGDKPVVNVFYSSQCPWSGWMADRIKRNMKKYDTAVNAINTDDRNVIEAYGISRGLSINGVPVLKRMASWKEAESIVKQAIAH